MNEDKINKIQEVIAKDLPSTSNVDVLSKRLHRVTGLSEDTTKLIAKEWKKSAGTLAVILLIVFVFNQYQNSVQRKSEESALAISNLQFQFSALLSPEPKESTDSTSNNEKKDKAEGQTDHERALISFRDNLALLTRYNNGSYQNLALIYSALEKLRSGDINGAKSILQKDMRVALGSTLSEPIPSKPISGPDFAQELGKFLLIKASLLEPNPDLSQIKEQLAQLAYESQLVTAEALVTLFRLSSSAEDRAKAAGIMQKILAVRPELNDIMQSEAKSFGLI